MDYEFEAGKEYLVSIHSTTDLSTETQFDLQGSPYENSFMWSLSAEAEGGAVVKGSTYEGYATHWREGWGNPSYKLDLRLYS